MMKAVRRKSRQNVRILLLIDNPPSLKCNSRVQEADLISFAIKKANLIGSAYPLFKIP
jgi:hypothetical protein